MSVSLRDVPPEVAVAVLGLALPALGVPAAATAAVVAAAPKLLPLVADLLERQAAGEPLPAADEVELLDDGATARAVLEAYLARVPR